MQLAACWLFKAHTHSDRGSPHTHKHTHTPCIHTHAHSHTCPQARSHMYARRPRAHLPRRERPHLRVVLLCCDLHFPSPNHATREANDGPAPSFRGHLLSHTADTRKTPPIRWLLLRCTLSMLSGVFLCAPRRDTCVRARLKNFRHTRVQGRRASSLIWTPCRHQITTKLCSVVTHIKISRLTPLV